MPLLPAREAAPGAAEAREDLRHAAEIGRVCALNPVPYLLIAPARSSLYRRVGLVNETPGSCTQSSCTLQRPGSGS